MPNDFFLKAITICAIGISFTVAARANAETSSQTYKCSEGGKTIYSQSSCKEGKSTIIDLKVTQPSEASIKQAAKDQKHIAAESKKLQQVREKAQAKEDARNRVLSAKHATAKKHCEDQRLKVKWAKEDLRNSQPRGEMKAQQKLRRSEEKAELSCKNL